MNRQRIRRIGLLMGLLLLVGTLFSCGGENETRELTAAGETTFLWNGICFYRGKTDPEDDSTETLKYIDLKDDASVGAPVYADVLNEGGDPFMLGTNAILMKVLVDEDATAENNGVPVLLALLPIPSEEDESGSPCYRAVSYNMANGQMKLLCENVGEGVYSFGVYGDRIYYSRFLGKFDLFAETTEGEEALFTLPKTGGEPRRVPFPQNDSTILFKFSKNGKLYMQAGYSVYRFDPEKETAERIFTLSEENFVTGNSEFYIGGYLYYRRNKRVVQKEGYSDLKIYDLYRHDLLASNGEKEEKDELVLEDVIASWSDGKKLYYERLGDGNPIEKSQTDGSVLRWYDPETGESGIAFDHSDSKQGYHWYTVGVLDGYVHTSYFNDDEYHDCFIDPTTGEERERPE